MKINQATRLPNGRHIFFEENSFYTMGKVNAIVERKFAPNGSESMNEILERLIMSKV